MKKLLSILFFIISINVFAQTKISAPLVRNNSADTGYGSHFDSLGYGGYVTYDNITTRNALPMPQRKYLMQVSVKETDSVYILEGGLTNEYWMPLFKASAGFPVPTWPQTMAVTNGRIFTADNFIHATGHSFVLDSVGGNGFQANYYPNDTDQYSVSVESFTAQLQFSTIHTSGINENHVTEPGVIYSNAAGTGSNSPVSSVDATDTSKVTITAYNNNGGDSISVYPDRVTMSMLNKNAYIGTGYSNCAGCNFLVGDSTTQKVSHITKADVSNLIVGDYLQVTNGKIGLGESTAGTTDPSIRLPGSSTVFNMLKQGTLTQLGNSGILAPKETITAWTTAINLPIVTQSTLLLVANHASPVNDSMFNTNIAGGIAGTFQQNITVPGDPPAKVYDGYGRGKTAAAVVGRIDYNLNDSTMQWFENYHPVYGFYLEPHVTRHGHIQNVNILAMGSVIDNLSDFSADTVGHTNYGYRSQFPNVSHGGVYWLNQSDQFVVNSDSIYFPNLPTATASTIVGRDVNGKLVSTTTSGLTPSLQAVTAVGNTTNIGINATPLVASLIVPPTGVTIFDSLGLRLVRSNGFRLGLSMSQLSGNVSDSFPSVGGIFAINNTNNNFTTPQYIQSTTAPQFRVAYDGSNYTNFSADGSGILTAENSSTNPAMRFKRTSTGTNNIVNSVTLNSTSTGDMTDGFGSSFIFTITDNAGIENNIGRLSAVRDGADNTGKLVFNTYQTGTARAFMNLSNDGKLYVGANLASNTAAAKIESLSTTEQLRTSFDATHYTSFTVNSSGNLTIAPIGGALSVTGTTALLHLIGNSSTPTIAANAGAGTSPTISVSGTDIAFKVTLTAGTTPSTASDVWTVTFNTAYGATPHVSATSLNANAAGLGVTTFYTPSTTTVKITTTAGVALVAAQQYIWDIHIIQ